jgi:hypothetical protein
VDLVSEAELPAGPRGEQGRTGKTGERGERGLSRVQGRAVVFLFAFTAAGIVICLLWTAHEVNTAAAQQRQQQVSQRAQGAALEHKLCITLSRLAALKPPAGSPAANPARAFDQQQQAVLAELGPDVGCLRGSHG